MVGIVANHKRKKAKHQRAGCLLCKQHKDERLTKTTRYKGLKGPRKTSNPDKLGDY